MSEAPGGGGGSLRLDKWLWHARFFRTRSLAAKACGEGAIRVDGTPTAKAHFVVRPGQVLSFVQGRQIRVVEVVALGERRGPAPEAETLYRDLAPPAPGNALPREPGGPPARQPGAGRPTKRDRRAVDRLHETE